MQDSEAVIILERIRGLEAELADCRRRLGSASETLPSADFLALEILLKGQFYLLPCGCVREVVQMAHPQPLGDTLDWVLGTIPFGDQTVPLVDLGLRLGQGMTEISPALFVIVTDTPRWLGLVAEGVGQVISVRLDSLTTPNPEIPCAPFLLATNQRDEGEVSYVLSIGNLGREFHV